MKNKNLFLVGLLGMLFVGCGEKTDEQLILEAFDTMKDKNTERTFVVNPKDAKEEIRKIGLDDSYGFTKTIKIKAGTYSTCSAGVGEMKGDWVHIHSTCENLEGIGDFYMKKVDGVWKIPVRE